MARSGKRQRREDKQSNVCFTFKKTGSCGYGEECKFSHDVQSQVAGLRTTAKQVENNKSYDEENDGEREEDIIPLSSGMFPDPNSVQANDVVLFSRITNPKKLNYELIKAVFYPGTYRQEVMGRNEDGFQGNQAEIHIERPIPPIQRNFHQYFLVKRNSVSDGEGDEVKGVKNVEHEDLRLSMHSNGVTMLALSPFHAALNDEKRKVIKIEFTMFNNQGNSKSRSRKKLKEVKKQKDVGVEDNLVKNASKDEVEGDQEIGSEVKGRWHQNVDDVKDFVVSGKSKKGGIFLVESHLICKVHCDDGNVYNVKTGIRGRLFEINTALEEHPDLVYTVKGFLIIMYPKKEETNKIKENLLMREEYLKQIKLEYATHNKLS